MKKIIMSLFVMLIMALAVNASYYTFPVLDKPELVVTYMSQDPDPVEPGGYVELKFKVENEGTEPAENVQVEILPEYPFTLDSGEDAVKSIGIIRGRQTGTDAFIVKFRLKVDKDAVSGDNTIDVRYNSDKTGWIKLEDNNVEVRSEYAILAVNDVKSDPEMIRPGEVAEVTMTLENMADALLKDIKVNLLLYKATHGTSVVVYEEKPFAPIGSSNEKTLNNLERGTTEDIVFKLMADPDADAGLYKIPLVVSYADNTGKNFSLEDNIVGLVVGDSPELVVFVEDSEISAAKTSGDVTVKFVNKGTTDIKFLYAKLAETDYYDIIGPEEVYVGNIDSDDYDTADFEIYLKKGKGKVILPLNVEYRDANNQFYKISVKLPLKIIPPEISGEKGGGSKFVGFLIVLAIVGAGIFFYRRWRKKKAKKGESFFKLFKRGS